MRNPTLKKVSKTFKIRWMVSGSLRPVCPWSMTLQNPCSQPPLTTHSNLLVNISLFFPDYCQLPVSPRIIQSPLEYHPKPLCRRAFCFCIPWLLLSRPSQWMASLVTTWRTWIQHSLRGDDLRVPLDSLITRVTYFGQSKIRFFQQTTENWKTDQWKQCWLISNDFIGCSYYRLNNTFKLRAESLCYTRAVFENMFLAKHAVTVS